MAPESVHIEGSTMYRFQQRLKLLKRQIKIWNKSEFGNILVEKLILESQLNMIKVQSILSRYTDELKKYESNLQEQLSNRYKQEEELWRQNSRIKWLKEGEKNTNFFHHSMLQRRQHNIIARLTSA